MILDNGKKKCPRREHILIITPPVIPLIFILFVAGLGFSRILFFLANCMVLTSLKGAKVVLRSRLNRNY